MQRPLTKSPVILVGEHRSSLTEQAMLKVDAA
jgi:hypothetical protein